MKAFPGRRTRTVLLPQMGRPLRSIEPGLIFHALNRANGRATLFKKDGDYAAFVHTLAQAV